MTSPAKPGVKVLNRKPPFYGFLLLSFPPEAENVPESALSPHNGGLCLPEPILQTMLTNKIFSSKNRNMTKKRLSRISDILLDVAQVTLGSIVIPLLIDKYNLPMLVLGLGMSCALWAGSVYLTR